MSPGGSQASAGEGLSNCKFGIDNGNESGTEDGLRVGSGLISVLAGECVTREHVCHTRGGGAAHQGIAIPE